MLVPTDEQAATVAAEVPELVTRGDQKRKELTRQLAAFLKLRSEFEKEHGTDKYIGAFLSDTAMKNGGENGAPKKNGEKLPVVQ